MHRFLSLCKWYIRVSRPQLVKNTHKAIETHFAGAFNFGSALSLHKCQNGVQCDIYYLIPPTCTSISHEKIEKTEKPLIHDAARIPPGVAIIGFQYPSFRHSVRGATPSGTLSYDALFDCQCAHYNPNLIV